MVRLAQQALAFQTQAYSGLRIKESICVDGLANFAATQFDPNNINQAIGRDSLFIYTFNFCGLNRSGRTSVWQKQKNYEIEQAFGRYNPRAIRVAVRDLFEELHSKVELGGEFTLITDEHFQYRRAIREDLAHLKIEHATISSKATRNYQNILFSVNHADLLIRQFSKAFARETISFSKTAGAMCQKFALFMIRKNFMEPQFTKKHRRRPKAHEQSPAQVLGLCDRILKFEDIFYRKSTPGDLRHMSDDLRHFWCGVVPRKYRRSKEFLKRAPLIPSWA